MKLKEIEHGMVVHCNTEKEAKELIKWAYECGFECTMSDNTDTYWNRTNGNGMCYYFEKINRILWSADSEPHTAEFSDLIIEESEKQDEELTAAEAIRFQIKLCKEYLCRACPVKTIDSRLDCNTIRETYPEEVAIILKQYKKVNSPTQPKEPETEWVWKIFTTGIPTEYKLSEEEAKKKCEEIVKTEGKNAWYSSICRVKE